jgi:SagB-type dehydrogenase family enzyme
MKAMRTQPAVRAVKSGLIRQPVYPVLSSIRPRFVHELVTVPFGDGLVVDGAHSLQVFKGKSTRSLLPELIPLMDGSRKLAELENALPGTMPEHVRAAVTMLHEAGLVEDGSDQMEAADAFPNETLFFLRRYSSATGRNRSGREACEKLQIAEVVIFEDGGTTPHGETLKALLQKTGVGRVLLCNRGSLGDWHPESGVPPAQLLIVSLALNGEDSESGARFDEWCAKNNLPWLRIAADPGGGYADIGPYFSVRDTSCYRCFYQIHGRPVVSADPAIARMRPAESEFWLSMAAVEIVYQLTEAGPVSRGRDFQRYDLGQWTSRQLRCARVPGCPRCRPLDDRVTEDRRSVVDTAVVFEDYAGLQSLGTALLREQAEPAHRPANPAQDSKLLSSCHHRDLIRELPKLERGTLDLLRGINGSARDSFSVDELSTLLMTCAGIKAARTPGSAVKRWSATGGNLGSVEVYVAVRNVSGLAPGLYFYDPRRHSLAHFERHKGTLPMEEFMRRVLGCSGELPDALALLTGALQRLTRKYGAFGYRLVNLDAGVAMSQLHLVARALGVWSKTAACWADDLIEEQLNLNPLLEPSTVVVELSAHPPARPDAGSAGADAIPSIPDSRRPLSDFQELSMTEGTAALCRESRRKEADISRAPSLPATETVAATAHDLPAVTLPEPARGGRLLSDVLARRVSVRRFAQEPVVLDHLSTMLFCAQQGDAEDWPDEQAEEHRLNFLVIASRFKGAEPGVYSYDARRNRLLWLKPAPAQQQKSELFVQREFTQAPAVVWIYGNLAGACARHGAFGHRLLLLRAGAAGHRLSTAAGALGVAGCLVGGVVPGAGRRQFGFDGYLRASLIGFATGDGAPSMK